MKDITFVARSIKYTLTKRAWTNLLVQALLLLVLCVLIRHQYIRVLPLIVLLFLHMFMAEGEVDAVYRKAHHNSYRSYVLFCLGGAIFLSFIIVNPVIELLLHYREIIDGMDITPFQVFLFLLVLPPAILSGLIIAFTIKSIQSPNPKTLARLKYWMSATAIPFLILTAYGWWKSYLESGNLTDVFWENFFSILFFILAIILYVYNSYKQRYKNDVSISFFILQVAQFIFSLLAGLSSVYFLLIREITSLHG